MSRTFAACVCVTKTFPLSGILITTVDVKIIYPVIFYSQVLFDMTNVSNKYAI